MLPRWIIGFGLLLIICDVVDMSLPQIDSGMNGRTLICGWVGGAMLVASGLAAAQGRRILRVGGLCVAVFLMIALGIFFTWDAAVAWREVTTKGASRVPATVLSLLGLGCVTLLGVINYLRPREGIASRGYTVPIPHVNNNRQTEAEPLERQHRRSEAG